MKPLNFWLLVMLEKWPFSTSYLRFILDELHVPQTFATLLYEDNRGNLLMAHAGQPTKQSCHIDI
jgi:hypothetical protein